MHLKTALMSYFRYKRQFCCGDEVRDCDVVVIDKEGWVYDIEVKISKADLWTGEAKKSKHKEYIEQIGRWTTPNYFYVCVPTVLLEEAKKWVKTVNPNYGIIEFTSENFTSKYHSNRYWEQSTYIRKKAKPLHNRVITRWQEVLLRRLSSAMTTVYQSRMEKK